MRLRNEMLPLLLLALATGPLMGVGTTGTIVGMVTDPSGALVANAKVTVLNQGTGAVREVFSNVGGEYAVPLLPPAVYQVTVEASGFRTIIDKDIKLNVDQTVRVNAKLELGAVSQAVVVNAAAPLIPTDTSTVGQVVNQQMVSQLPLNERNFLQFTLLVPGAQMPSDGSQNSTQGGAVSVDGAREQSNNFLLDGVDNNDLAINQYSVLPSMDAIEEFKVQSSNSSAEFGRSAGGQINVVLKSGTNQLHGTAFEFLRNRHMDAKDFFDRPDCNPSTVPGTCADIPRLDRSQFGGSLSGPIRRDKAFFLLDYEGLRLRQATTRQATVPSQVELATALAAVPPSSSNPAGLNVLNLYPAANVGTDLANSNTFVASPVIRNTVHQFTGKFDYQGWTTNTLSGHYALFDENRFNPYDPLAAFTNLPGYGSFTKNRGQNVGLDWTHIFSSRVVNEARMGFNRLRAGIFQEHFGTDESKALGFPDVLSSPIDLGFPNVVIAGFDAIGEPANTPQDRHDNTFHYSDNLAWSPAWNGGRHTMKFGVDVRRFQLNFYLDSLARGEWLFFGGPTGDPLQELLNGTPDLVAAVQGNTQTALRTTGFDYYAQDDIHLNSRLTLNLGLRYEFNSPAVDIHDRLTVPDLSSNSATCTPQPDCQFIRGGTSGIPRATYRPTKNNYAPSAGFAWRPLASDRLVVRGAYGVFYDVAILNGNILPRFNPPFFAVNLFFNSGTNTIQDILSQPGLAPPVQPSLISPDYRDGNLQHWTLDVQEEVAHDLVLDVGYVGSEGTHLVDTRDINQAMSPGGAFPFPQFSDIEYIESGASSNYHSLQLRIEKRFSRGLTFLSAYTWSKSIDDASALAGTRAELGFPQNSYDLHSERGLSNFDTRHRFVTSTIYELPFGSGKRWLSGPGPLNAAWGNWKLSGILAFQSGRPFTVYRDITVDQSLTLQGSLGFFDRPDLIADPFKAGPVAGNSACVAPSRIRDASSWFNPCAFASPPASIARFGTAGRNDITGPPLDNLDFSLLKEFPLRNEARRIQLRFEFFNLLNRPNFDLPNNDIDAPTFAAIQSANAYGNKPPRQIQLGLKFVF